MGVTIAENREELVRKKRRACEHRSAEENDAACDHGVKVTQLAFVVTARERRNKNIRQHVHEHGEDHGETSKGPDFGDGCSLAREKTDQEDGDLSLKAIKECVRSQALN